MKLLFDVGNLRSQVVYLWRMNLLDGTEEWMQIESPPTTLRPRRTVTQSFGMWWKAVPGRGEDNYKAKRGSNAPVAVDQL